MLRGVGCTLDTFDDFSDGIERKRIPYGSERRLMAALPRWEVQERCHDCGAPLGLLHHPGCDMEECPNCGGQAICCECSQDG
jgi:hypothetical protein